MTTSSKLLLAAAMATLLSFSAEAAERAARDVVQAFFNKVDVSDKADWFTGEIEKTPNGPRTIGQTLPPGVKIDMRPLQESRDRAVYAVVLTLNGESLDWYAYLSKKNGGWQMEAVRALVLPGFIGQLYTHLRDKKQRTPEEELQYRNFDLTFRSDERLKDYFAAHRGKLEDIKEHFLKQGDQNGLAEKTKALHVVGVQTNESGCVEIVVGGFMDNLVGFMFVPEGKSPPAIDRSSYIMIDQVAGHWYLYKTT
jgi:hypothetical protein